MADLAINRSANGGGYGIVEPNHLSAQRTGQIYAQLPAASGITVLENGQFVKYDYATVDPTTGVQGQVNFTGAGEWMLVMNEVKLYNEQYQTLSDFAQLKADAVDGVIVPRVYKTNIGDIFTTNCVEDASYALGDLLTVDTDGILHEAAPNEGDVVWQVVKQTTMPDGSNGLKLMRIVNHV